MECEKLSQDKTEMQRHYVMVKIIEKLICGYQISYLFTFSSTMKCLMV